MKFSSLPKAFPSYLRAAVLVAAGAIVAGLFTWATVAVGGSVRGMAWVAIGPAVINKVDGKATALIGSSPTSTPSAITPKPAADDPRPPDNANPRYAVHPVTIGGNTYGAEVVPGEAGSASWPSNEPLVLSATQVSYGQGGHSAEITASSPDGYDICNVSQYNLNLVAATNYPGCGAHSVFFVDGHPAPGAYVLHVFADTRDKVHAGKYIRYDGYITVTITNSPPSFYLAAGNYSLTRESGNPAGTYFYHLDVPLIITTDMGYISSPPIYLVAASGTEACESQSVPPVGSLMDQNKWDCAIEDGPQPHAHVSLTFRANDTVTTREITVPISF